MINKLKLDFNVSEIFISKCSNYFQNFFEMIIKFQVLNLKISIILKKTHQQQYIIYLVFFPNQYGL